MQAIIKREFKSFFSGILGYLTASLMLILMGIYASLYNFQDGYSDFEYVLNEMCSAYLIITPIITMRSFAEERRAKIDQLLLTSPISPISIVLGKYFAIMGLLLIPVLFACFYPLIYLQYGQVNLPIVYSSIFAYYLLGSATVSLGILVSSLCSNSTIAGLVTFFLLFLSYIMSGLLRMVSSSEMVAHFIVVLITIIAGAIVYSITRSKRAALLCILSFIAIATFFFWIFPVAFVEYLLQSLRSIQIFAQFSVFTYGLLDFSILLNYLCFSAVFLLLCSCVIESARG